MTFDPADTVILPKGDHRPTSVCYAFVGSHIVPGHWAFQAMHLAFPPMAQRSLMGICNDNLDVARNFALNDWSKAPGELRTDWIALIAVGSYLRSDAIVAAIVDGAPVTRVGETYILRRDAVLEPPWFRSGVWTGIPAKDRTDDLSQDIFGSPRRIEPVVAPTPAPNGEGGQWQDARQLITIGIPTLGKVSLPWVVNAVRLAPPMTCTASLVVAEGHPVAPARQKIVDTVLMSDPRPAYLLFWGDDNLPPPDGLRLLLDTSRQYDAPAVAGLYHLKSFPPVQPIIWKHGHPGPMIPGKDFQVGEILQVDGTGLDFVLLKVDALEKLPPLKFRTVLDWVEGKGIMMQTEDAFFWDRWREVHGKGPLVDTRCRVGHYSSFDGAVY